MYLNRNTRRACLGALFCGLVGIAAIACPAEPRAVKQRVAPVYPEVARRLKVGGVVKLEATVDPAGKVKDVRTLSGARILSVAAEDAVARWKFAPAAAQSNEDVEINFELKQ
ncbi:MAG: energy transducer TonB [Terracidiphilus sp.]